MIAALQRERNSSETTSLLQLAAVALITAEQHRFCCCLAACVTFVYTTQDWRGSGLLTMTADAALYFQLAI